MEIIFKTVNYLQYTPKKGTVNCLFAAFNFSLLSALASKFTCMTLLTINEFISILKLQLILYKEAIESIPYTRHYTLDLKIALDYKPQILGPTFLASFFIHVYLNSL